MLKCIVKPQLLFQSRLNLMRSSSSVINERVQYFDEASVTWWNFNGSMKQMHLAHPHQMSFIRHQLRLKDGTKPEATSLQPLTGYKIADVGCGVGMNSESLALLGAEVTGLDPAERAIEHAKAHAVANPKLEGKLKYIVSTAEDHRLTHSGHYDAVLVFFLLEHIQNRQEFIDNCLALLKPNGSLLISHNDRSVTWYCYMLWQTHVTGLFKKSLLRPSQKTFLTNDEVMALVNRGHPCELKGQQNLFWTMDGQGCRVINSKRFIDFSHYVRK